MINILICDDEKDIVNALKIYLSSEGYNIFEAFNGKQAVDSIRDNNIQLVIMDIMMPVMDGISAMAKMRETSNIPVILLTAKGEDADKILGLTVGADDYITKPFKPAEVIARVKSQLRRYMNLGGAIVTGSTYKVGGLELNDETKQVYADGENVRLTPIEYDILMLLMQTPGKVYSIKEIADLLWNESAGGAESSVPVHIRHLREKLEINPSEPRYIKVVWGHGYTISPESTVKKQ